MTRRCTECGSTDIEVDTTRADAVCTNCGVVLESSIIVSDIQFEENAHGGSSAIGTFVSSDSKGGKNVGSTFTASIGRESREITLKNARKKIVALAQQLRLRPDHIDMAFYFFKLALSKHLTRGRKSTHVIAACVYITCRTEGTSHMLIDFSDIMQIDVYELGRTYLRLSQALCINIPAMDPCLYVMRFAHRLEFGDKTHEVSMTALRLVSRMKKDWIHFGRRPSGLCGAALLIAGRLHEFSRSINDVIKVVKVHESTLRKRLNEFGDTPASQLTLEEFMTVDLDAMTEEQDPPSFKAARKKDRERLTRLEEDENLEKEMSKLEELIEKELEERKGKGTKKSRDRGSVSEDAPSSVSSLSDPESVELEDTLEEDVTARFLSEQTLGIISQCLDGKTGVEITSQEQLDYLLMPPPTATPSRHSMFPSRVCVNSPGMGLRNTVEEYLTLTPHNIPDMQKGEEEEEKEEELDLTGIDDAEIDTYIMSDAEIRQKTQLWLKLNAEYLLEQEEKIKQEKYEREEMIKAGKDPDKKRKMKKKPKMNHQSNSSAIEAIEKIVQEKKISTKINYDVLRSLNQSSVVKSSPEETLDLLKARVGEKAGPEELAVGAEEAGKRSCPAASEPELSKRVKTEDTAAAARSRVRPNLQGRPRGRTRPAEARPRKLVETPPKPQRTVNFSDFLGVKTKSAVDNVSQGLISPTKMVEVSTVVSTSSSVTEVALAGVAEVVVEGPDTNLHTESEVEEELEEEDESELSAAQLLNRHMGGGSADHYAEEEEFY